MRGERWINVYICTPFMIPTHAHAHTRKTSAVSLGRAVDALADKVFGPSVAGLVDAAVNDLGEVRRSMNQTIKEVQGGGMLLAGRTKRHVCLSCLLSRLIV